METLYYTVDRSNVDDYGTRTIQIFRKEDRRVILVGELEALQSPSGLDFYTNEEEIRMYLEEHLEDHEVDLEPIRVLWVDFKTIYVLSESSFGGSRVYMDREYLGVLFEKPQDVTEKDIYFLLFINK